MLGRIETIEQFHTAVRLMQTGQTALFVGLFLTLLLLGLAGASAWLKDERLAHAARRGQYALFLLTAFCCALLYVGIFDGYFFVNYIERVTENNEELAFKIAALWASQQGSLLFWCFILTGFGATFAFTQRHNRTDRRLPYTLIALAVVQFFFFFILTSPTDGEAAQRSSPFSMMYHWMGVAGTAGHTIQGALHEGVVKAPQHGWDLLRVLHQSGDPSMKLGTLQSLILNRPHDLPPEAQKLLLEQISDGNGMNPQLHNYWVAIHPPMLYLGFVGFTIPFAYAIGSLLSGEVGEGWLKPIRLWTMMAWGFLTVGIALGGLWAYEILGWGGYWAWDPVENASFIPWLTGTAFIHSVIVTERRGMLRLWSFALIIITYCMTVIGTFMVRSGIINSVHAFGATGDVDTWFYAFLVIVLLGSLLAVVWRAPLLKPDRKLDSIFSREGSFVLNNLMFVAIALVTLIITMWPLITTQLLGEDSKHEFGQDAYVMMNVPMLLLVLLLMGVGPALAWQRNTARQAVRAFLAPTIAAFAVGAINVMWLQSNELLISTDRADMTGAAAAWVRWVVQLTLWPICAFTFVCIVMEFAAGARARVKSTGEAFLVALGRVTLGNRRRYGGYIVHIGVLLIALGIYYSSFYEAEGTVIANPGGYGVIEDKLTGDKLLVVYESSTRTDSWDALKSSFGRNPQTAQIYENMLSYVRQNPDMSAPEIIETITANFPPEMGAPPPAMVAAIHWGVAQRERSVVYESFDTTLRVYAYTPPTELNSSAYLDAHDKAASLLLARGEASTELAAAEQMFLLLVQGTLAAGGGLGENFALANERIQTIGAKEFLDQTGLARQLVGIDEAGAQRVQNRLTAMVTQFSTQLAELRAQGLLLGAELPEIHRAVRHDLSELPPEVFAKAFALDAAAGDFESRRFADLKLLEQFHTALEADVVSHRNEVVQALALKLPDERAAATLESMRPLTLAGLHSALEKAKDDAVIQAIEAELAATQAGSTAVHPGMRIFYDKRTGAPKMGEPVKDPQYHRTLSRDAYFILQDAKLDGTGTFRFFIKPQMALGLAGLAVVIVGTVLAFLPAVRRRRTV